MANAANTDTVFSNIFLWAIMLLHMYLLIRPQDYYEGKIR